MNSGTRRVWFRFVIPLLVATSLRAAEQPQKNSNPTVEIKTSMGSITVELYADKAPITVKNFLGYADDKFYDGTVFHRIMDGFMIQGGGFTADKSQKKTKSPIKNEAGNGLKNERGTLAMARTGVVDSATAQFFINHENNTSLDHRDETAGGFGYAVFGKVVQGMDVVDKIAKVETRPNERGEKSVPVKNVVIESIRRAEKKPESK